MSKEKSPVALTVPALKLKERAHLSTSGSNSVRERGSGSGGGGESTHPLAIKCVQQTTDSNKRK